jgi:hypothetical protein
VQSDETVTKNMWTIVKKRWNRKSKNRKSRGKKFVLFEISFEFQSQTSFTKIPVLIKGGEK